MDFKTFLHTLLVFCSFTPALLLGIAPAIVMNVAKTTERGVPSTQPPSENEVKVAKTYYKDYYKKTQVLVHHPVSTDLYMPVEYQDTDVYESITSQALYHTHMNVTTTSLQSSMVETVIKTPNYEEYAWPLETQFYTIGKANNTQLINATVENGLPFI